MARLGINNETIYATFLLEDCQPEAPGGMRGVEM